LILDESLRNRIDKLRSLASQGSVDERTLRYEAMAIREKLRPYGYTITIRRMPEWYSGPRYQVIIAKIGGRGRGSKKSSRTSIVEELFYNGFKGDKVSHS